MKALLLMSLLSVSTLSTASANQGLSNDMPDIILDYSDARISEIEKLKAELAQDERGVCELDEVSKRAQGFKNFLPEVAAGQISSDNYNVVNKLRCWSNSKADSFNRMNHMTYVILQSQSRSDYKMAVTLSDYERYVQIINGETFTVLNHEKLSKEDLLAKIELDNRNFANKMGLKFAGFKKMKTKLGFQPVYLTGFSRFLSESRTIAEYVVRINN